VNELKAGLEGKLKAGGWQGKQKAESSKLEADLLRQSSGIEKTGCNR
jgi:hypothetical protein